MKKSTGRSEAGYRNLDTPRKLSIPRTSLSNPQLRKTSEQEKPPSRLRRLSSFTNSLASPIGNAIRSFSRNRLPSGNSSVSGKTKKTSPRGQMPPTSRIASLRQPNPSFNPLKPTASSKASTHQPPRNLLVRSSTTSFLPVPSGKSLSSPAKPPPALVHSQTTAVLYRSRIPTPTGPGIRNFSTNLRKSSLATSEKAFLASSQIKNGSYQSSDSLTNIPQLVGNPKRLSIQSKHPNVLRSRTQPNLLCSAVDNPKQRGEDKENIKLDQGGSGPALRKTSHIASNIGWRDSLISTSSGDEPSPLSDGGIRFAQYAFSPRKMTPSVALETALSIDVDGAVVTKKQQAGLLVRCPTPPTIKKLTSTASRPSEPRVPSTHLITQYKLLQPIQPESPSKMPGKYPSSEPGTPRAIIGISHQGVHSPAATHKHISPLRQVSFDTSDSSEDSEDIASAASTQSSYTAARNLRQVVEHRPSAYWAGRFSTLHDRLMFEAFDGELIADSPSMVQPFVRPIRGTKDSNNSDSSGRSNGSHSRRSSMEEEEREQALCLRIFELLEESCVGSEAIISLRIFRNAYAKRYDMPKLHYRLPPSSKTATPKQQPLRGFRAMRLSSDSEGEHGLTEMRRPSFVDRPLMGSGRAAKGRRNGEFRRSIFPSTAGRSTVDDDEEKALI